ncbi:MAG: phosphate ABC transporter substrate-binding protein [bacterium]|nr:phosphate ABC transporter substrate-binding protein [bacterium]
MYRFIITLTLISYMMIGCTRTKVETINMAGSTAFQPFAEKLAEEYMAKNKDIRINVQGGGSAVGIQSVQSGVAQIGMADMVSLPKEAEGLNSVVVAKDGVVLIVHPDNKIDGLSTKQIQQIFSGRLKNWSELDGEDGPITVISREEGSGTRASFEELVLKDTKVSPEALIQDSTGAVRIMVENDLNSIGYISYGFVTPKVKTLKIDGVAPTLQNIREGKYKLTRPIFLLTKGEPVGGIKEFIEFILSNQAQQLISDYGLVAIR